MEPHWQCSAERMRACDVVLYLDDTTELNFNGQDIAGLGQLSYEAQRGMYVHATYAVTPQGEPLGVLNTWCGRVSARAPVVCVAAGGKARAGIGTWRYPLARRSAKLDGLRQTRSGSAMTPCR